MNLYGKNVVVYGGGISGQSACALALEKGAKAIIYDDDPNMGTTSKSAFKNADVIILSPGVSGFKDFLLDARLEGKKILSELQFASNFCAAEQIAVTGTNGKTTATLLIRAMLARSGKTVYAVGNIGAAFSAVADKLDATDIAVIEASSFQLEGSPDFSPDAAVLLNILPDHLDRHGGMQNYIAAKSNVFLNQAPQDIVVYNADDKNIAPLVPLMTARKIPFRTSAPIEGGAYISSGFICFDGRPIVALEDIDFKGREVENALAAVCIGMSRGLSVYTVQAALTEFKRPAYRRQFEGNVWGIKVYNDSKATNIASCLSACESLDDDAVLILGGALGKEDFDFLFRALPSKIKAIAIYGANKGVISEAAAKAGYDNITQFANLSDAFGGSLNIARDGGIKTILFSPASKSFDSFKNFEMRGEYFSKCVKRAGDKL